MASRLPVAVVTGTNSGLGLALSIKLAATHRVYAGMRGASEDKSAKLIKLAQEANVLDNIIVQELDVNSDESVSEAFGRIEEESGRCDVLVNNAGFSVFGTLEMLDMATMKAQFETNLFGVIRCQMGALPMMRRQKSGKIVNVSSVGGVWGQPFNDIYCASKFAVEGMSEAQAPVFKELGIHVTNVQPGGIKSAFIANAKLPDLTKIPAEYGPGLQRTSEVYRQGTTAQTPEEVADEVMKQVINVDSPPLKVQTNKHIQAVFEMQLGDTTGNAGVDFASKRFLAPAAEGDE